MFIVIFFNICVNEIISIIAYDKGNTSRQVYTLMQKLTRTQNKQSDNFGKAQIDALLLIDRSIDLYSPLLTQLTYEGLLDELFGIRNNSVKVAASKFAQIDQQSSRSTISSTSQSNVDDPPTELKQIMLHSAEMLYSQLRDLNFNAVPLVLKQTSRTLNSQFEQRHEARSVGELRAFVERIPQLQATKKSLATHLVLAEQLSEVVSSETFRQILTAEQQLIMSQQTEHAQVYIEQAIACSEPFNRVLRLLCLQSLVCNGIKTKMFESLKRELLQVYGYEQLLTMSNLAKCGLFKAAGAVSTATKNPNRNYTSVGRLLRLTADNVNEQNPNDAAYVHSCFAPICARVVQLLLNGGWRAVADVMRQLNESHFEHHQTKGNEPYPLQKTSASIHSGSSAGNEEPRTLMVFFIGGCTFAEISSLRFLVRHEEANADIIVGTTKLINGNNFIDSLCEKLEANP